MVKCNECEEPAIRQKLCERHYKLLGVHMEAPRKRCKFCRTEEHRSGLCWKHYLRLNKKIGATRPIILEENI